MLTAFICARSLAAILVISNQLASSSATAIVGAAIVQPRLEQHRTPFGIRAGGCTIEVPSRSRIDEVIRDGVPGVLVTRPRQIRSPSDVAEEDDHVARGRQEQQQQQQHGSWEWGWESDTDAFFYPTPAHCHEDMAALLHRRQHMMRGRQQRLQVQRQQKHLSQDYTFTNQPPPYSGRPSKVWTPDNFTCSTLPCDGWIDNAGWEINGEGNPWPLSVKQFNATYVLPPVPPQRRSPSNCTFNYSSTDTCPGISFFTGLENSDGWDRLCRWSNCSEPHGPLAHSILQPVLEYYDCPHPMDESYCARSWACCPFNVTVTSTALEGLRPDDHVRATIAVEMGGAPMYGPPYSTVSTSIGHYPHEELSTVLHVHTYQRHYNWADITQEIYGVAQCNEFTNGSFIVSNISMANNKGEHVDMSKVEWLTTTQKPCGGKTTVANDGTEVQIEHDVAMRPPPPPVPVPRSTKAT